MAPRIAVIGCGAIARDFHLPALARRRGIKERLILVDSSIGRAERLAAEFGAAATAKTHRDVVNEVDGAVVAVPPEHHAPVALDFLAASVPVFCEKPLAVSAEEARQLVHAGRERGVPIAVNQIRRLFPALRATRSLIEQEVLGKVTRVEIYDGAPFGWPLASGATFGRAAGGRGILQDIGSHVLDTVCWWLGVRPTIRRYLDDSLGGTEAVARVEFGTEGGDGVVQLSWLSNLSNTFLVRGEKHDLRGEIRAWDHIFMTDRRTGRTKRIRLRGGPKHPLEVRDHMVGNFVDVISGRAEPFVPASEVIPSIEMIDTCYRNRERFHMPWLDLEGVRYALG